MQLGLNLPWIECGHDFGYRPPAWGHGERPERDYEAMADELARLRDAMGTNIVRMWVLAGGVNYPAGVDVLERCRRVPWPLEEGLRIGLPKGLRRRALKASGVSTYERIELGDAPLPPLSGAFLEDFAALLSAFKKRGLRLMPVLVSFEFFHPVSMQVGEVASRGRNAFVFGDSGRDFEQIERFLDATLSPLLKVSENYRDAIEAWEVMNEPDWSTEGGPLHARLDGDGFHVMPKTVPADMMSAFLERSLRRITDAGFVSSVGFKKADPTWVSPSLRDFMVQRAATGEYLHQVHHYPSLYEPGRLKPHASLPIQPCIVGEMATIQGKPLGLHIAWWRERLGDIRRAGKANEYLRRRLEIIEELGYPMALLWSVQSKDIATDMSPEVVAQVKRYTQRSARLNDPVRGSGF